MPSFSFSPAELAYLHTSLSQNPPIRLDSRSATSFRPLNAETDVLPSTNGSAHLNFSDGSEAIVGIKAEVERTSHVAREIQIYKDAMDIDTSQTKIRPAKPHGRPEWINLEISLPGLRDDDSTLVFLSEMLTEALTAYSHLQDSLVINNGWHWKLYIDVLLISPFGLSSFPLPLLSLTTHLALRSTRLPRLKSEGEEDPMFDDDWQASTFIYPKQQKGKTTAVSEDSKAPIPPITLLVMMTGTNVIFDPSREELAVADGVLAVSVGQSGNSFKILAIRMIDTPARDTFKGTMADGKVDETTQGVWRPKLGGIKRSALKDITRSVLGEDGSGGVAKEVMEGLEGFLKIESGL